jgi:type IV pilus assembly protein PilC
MLTFSYSAMNAAGHEMQGTLEAADQQMAADQLKRQGLFPTDLSERGGAKARQAAPARTQPTGGLFAPRLKSKLLCEFTRQLATLLEAGMPLLRSLRLLQLQQQNPPEKRIIGALAEAIEAGSSFTEALRTQPRTFDHLYISMAKAGEASGALEQVLLKQAEYLEKRRRIGKKVKGAMVYPALVCTVAMLITTGLMVFIVPKFAAMFEQMLDGKALPPLTRWVIGASEIMLHQGYWLALGIVGLAMGVRLIRMTDVGAQLSDRLLLRLPGFGRLLRMSACAQFCRTLGTLAQSGVPILSALQIVRDACSNRVISSAVQKLHDAVKEGESMSGTMGETGAFPVVLTGMVQVGEETGALPEMLTRVAGNYEEEVDNAVEALVSLIEPTMIVVLAAVVGTIVIALFLPLIVLISSLG